MLYLQHANRGQGLCLCRVQHFCLQQRLPSGHVSKAASPLTDLTGWLGVLDWADPWCGEHKPLLSRFLPCTANCSWMFSILEGLMC